MKDFDLRKYLAEGRLLKENRELSQDEVTTIYNNFMDTYKYKETVIDDPDGTKEKGRRLELVLTNDPGLGIARYADAGYRTAKKFASTNKISLPKT